MTGNYTVIDFSGSENKKTACLTLDLEQDYGELLEEPSYEGLEHVPELVSFFQARNLPLTCFVQGSLFESNPSQVQALAALDCEFELHSYSHPAPREMNIDAEIKQGKAAYRAFLGKDPTGYRAPLGVVRNGDYEILAAHGFGYDSSIFPSLRPGAFNNLWKPTQPYILNEYKIVEFPFAVVSSLIRIPVALSYVKLLGRPYLRLLRSSALPNLIVFDFHLHDLFALTSASRLPMEKYMPVYRWAFRRIYQKNGGGLGIFDELISILRGKGYTFKKLIDVYEAVPR